MFSGRAWLHCARDATLEIELRSSRESSLQAWRQTRLVLSDATAPSAGLMHVLPCRAGQGKYLIFLASLHSDYIPDEDMPVFRWRREN